MTCLVPSSVCDTGLVLAVDIAPNYKPMQENHLTSKAGTAALSLCPFLTSVRGQETLSYLVWTAHSRGWRDLCPGLSWVCQAVLWAWPPLGWRRCWLPQGQSTASCPSQHSQHIVLGTWEVIFHLWYLLCSRAGWITQGSLDTRQAKRG